METQKAAIEKALAESNAQRRQMEKRVAEYRECVESLEEAEKEVFIDSKSLCVSARVRVHVCV